MPDDNAAINNRVNDLWENVAEVLYDKPIGSKRTFKGKIRRPSDRSQIIKIEVKGEVIPKDASYPSGSRTVVGGRGIIVGRVKIS